MLIQPMVLQPLPPIRKRRRGGGMHGAVAAAAPQEVNAVPHEATNDEQASSHALRKRLWQKSDHVILLNEFCECVSWSLPWLGWGGVGGRG